MAFVFDGIFGELGELLGDADADAAGFGERVALDVVHENGELIELEFAFNVVVGFIAFAVQLV